MHDESSRSRQAGRMGWSLAAAGTVTGVFVLSNAPTPLYVRWQEAWGFTSGTLTVVFAAYMVGLIATLLTAGTLADRHGRKVVLLPGLAAAVASAVCFLFASNVLVSLVLTDCRWRACWRSARRGSSRS